MDGDTVLHVVAASGDGEEFRRCAKMIVQNYKNKNGGTAVAARRLLEARKEPKDKGDTPLHCAAGAGNANMISCLIGLIANNGDANEATTAMRIKNQCGETALHQAIRIDQLMNADPELACIPRDDEDGASPLYLAISLGKLKIARHLYTKSLPGKLSYSGPDGRNVLHAAVPRDQGM
jgi:ankyrin repeat protein